MKTRGKERAEATKGSPSGRQPRKATHDRPRHRTGNLEYIYDFVKRKGRGKGATANIELLDEVLEEGLLVVTDVLVLKGPLALVDGGTTSNVLGVSADRGTANSTGGDDAGETEHGSQRAIQKNDLQANEAMASAHRQTRRSSIFVVHLKS